MTTKTDPALTHKGERFYRPVHGGYPDSSRVRQLQPRSDVRKVRQPLSEQSRVLNLREFSERIEVLAREFKRLVDVVSDNQVQEPYLALVEGCGVQVKQTLSHVGTMVETLNAMAQKPTYARQFIVAPRATPFYRSFLP